MEDEQLILKWDSHHTTFNYVIGTLRHKEFYTDITLACNGKFYPLHKLVLSTCSEYFSEIFEINECSNTMVILTDIQCLDLELLLDYMYTGEVNVRKDEMTSFLKAAEFLRIKSLSSHYEKYNSSNFSNMSDIQSCPLKSTSSDARFTGLNPRRCNSPMQNIEISKTEVDVSEFKFDPSIEFSDILQMNEENDPLSISASDVSNLAGTSGIGNYTNSFLDSNNSEFKDSLYGAMNEQISPPKRKRTGEDRNAGIGPSSSKSCTLLGESPIKCTDKIPETPIIPVTFRKEINTNPFSVKDNTGLTESLYDAVSDKHTVISLASPNAPLDQVIEFFREKGVLKRQMFCDHCKTSMTYCETFSKKDGYDWRCYYDKCKKKYTGKSIRVNSPFHNTRRSLKQWLHLLHQYTCGTSVFSEAQTLVIRNLFAEQFE